jgi:hypothetical protein
MDESIKFAPGEGQRPLLLFLDEHAEKLSFSSIYTWAKKEQWERVSINDTANSELRRKNSRCAKCMPNIFYKHMLCNITASLLTV